MMMLAVLLRNKPASATRKYAYCYDSQRVRSWLLTATASPSPTDHINYHVLMNDEKKVRPFYLTMGHKISLPLDVTSRTYPIANTCEPVNRTNKTSLPIPQIVDLQRPDTRNDLDPPLWHDNVHLFSVVLDAPRRIVRRICWACNALKP